MIIFVHISPRRTIVVEVPNSPTGFRGVEGQKGFLTAQPTFISDAMAHPKALRLAGERAKETGQLLEYSKYERRKKIEELIEQVRLGGDPETMARQLREVLL